MWGAGALGANQPIRFPRGTEVCVSLAQVHWAKDDPEGRPVLVVHLEAALRQDAAGAKQAAEAILTHMECALQQRLADDAAGPEQVVVVLDSRGAPTLQVRLLSLNHFELGACVLGGDFAVRISQGTPARPNLQGPKSCAGRSCSCRLHD